MSVHERQRVIDTEDEAEFATFDLDIEGEVHRVSLDEAEPLREGRLSPAVIDALERRHGVVASSPDVWRDDGRSRVWVIRLDEVARLGTVDAVRSADERSPGHFAVDLLGYVATDAPDDWLSVGYFEMVHTRDPEVVGVSPQMKELLDPPRMSLYGDRTYTRPYRDAFPPALRLDLFKMEPQAILTDLIDATWLASSGRFVSPRLAEMLHDFVVPDVTYIDLDAHQSGYLVPLVFVHIFDSTVVDWPNSQFLATNGIHDDFREWFSVDSPAGLLSKRKELHAEPPRPSIVPDRIRFVRRPDLVQIGFEFNPFISYRLARRMAAEKITGVELKPPTALIG